MATSYVDKLAWSVAVLLPRLSSLEVVEAVAVIVSGAEL